MGEMYRKFYLFIYTFLGTRLQVRPVDGFSCLMAQTTGFVDIAPHFVGEIPQNHNFWA